MGKTNPFMHSFRSRHSPEALWESLRTPLSPELNHRINSPRVNLEYEGLGEGERIVEGTRFIYTPRFSAIGIFEKQLLRFAPDEGIGVVDSVSEKAKTRLDVIEPGQVARGHMEYRVDEGEDETSVLAVRGEFAIEGMAKVIANVWPSHLGDINEWLVEYGIRNPAERLAEHAPDVLAHA
ncbi:MAG TPA: hypothetical protein VFX79_00740 [Candidatus Saccharimonadales bacterium]|nr:hypothetical protein [Candidatus Saccharimonadales bacterium]